MVTEIAGELPAAIEIDGTLTEVESVTWTEEPIEIDGQLEEVP